MNKKAGVVFFVCMMAASILGYNVLSYYAYGEMPEWGRIYDQITMENRPLVSALHELFDGGNDEFAADVSVLQTWPGVNALNAYNRINIQSAEATSERTEETNVYNLFDGLGRTSWQARVLAYGLELEEIEAQFDRVYRVKYIALRLGNWESKYAYEKYKIPKVVTISIGNIRQTLVFQDSQQKVKWIEFSRPVLAGKIRLVIEDVFEDTRNEGDDGAFMAVSEIEIYGE